MLGLKNSPTFLIIFNFHYVPGPTYTMYYSERYRVHVRRVVVLHCSILCPSWSTAESCEDLNLKLPVYYSPCNIWDSDMIFSLAKFVVCHRQVLSVATNTNNAVTVWCAWVQEKYHKSVQVKG